MHEATVITVGGCRGPVGKSLLAAQLAWSLANVRRRVALVDLDLAGANLHRLVGAAPPRATNVSLVSRTAGALGSLSETPHCNLLLIPGGQPALSRVTLNPSVRTQLAEQLRSLPVEVVVVDVGAGVGYDPVDLLELGHRRLVVSSCEPSAVQDAYALFKAAVRRLIHRHLEPAGQLGLLEPGLRTWEGERMSHVLGRVQRIDPALHEALTRDLANFGGALLGTQVMDIGHIGALQALSALAAEYLGVTVPLLGWLPNGARLPDLATAPFDNLAPDGAEAQALRAMAEALLRPSPSSAGSEPERRRPMVYVRPPRRRLREAPAASEAQSGRRPRIRLPGMPPRRDRS